ncbi:hypothetical protein [Paludibaculum fermentans]|uniref:Uncharacterized protein n=1 Tax=Paludibaculum fermentans TaxID=1473598 RepID=A0A7S7NX81_PALFE|nr:hypothetical protein [Paludibaculum fermentans]QOY91473.1 hypothetical protein IRI77_16445 [Paludibaculum fermentans]
MLTDSPQKAQESGRASEDFVNYHYVLSDDEKFAIVEFSVQRPTKASLEKINAIAASKEPGVAVFEHGKSSRQAMEAEFRKYKKDFSFEEFAGFKVQGGKN